MQNHNIPRLALVGELGSRPSTEERKAYNIARCYYWLADLKLDPVAVGSPFQTPFTFIKPKALFRIKRRKWPEVQLEKQIPQP